MAVKSGHCQIRQASIVLKDGVEVSKSFHRWAAVPGADLSFLDNELSKISVLDKTHKIYEKSVIRAKSICKASWTKEIIAKYQAEEKKRAEDTKAKGIFIK